MKKKIILAGFLLLVLVAIFWRPNPSSSTKENALITISHTIVSRQKPAKDFEKIQIAKGSTELEILKKIAIVKTSGQGKNAFVASINNQEASAQAREFWAFYVNGKQAKVGAGSYILQDNDKIEWKIEEY